MATRKPIVIGSTGRPQQLQAGDTLGATSFLSTTEPVRMLYDSTHYSAFSVSAAGDLAIGGTTGKLTVANLTDSGLTSGRIPYASTGGLLADSASMAFDGTTLSVPSISTLNVGTLPDFYNYLINGGFDFFQRTAPATLTSRSDDTYGPDRWNILSQTTSVQTQRVTGDTLSVNAGQLKQNQAAAQRMGMEQIIEGLESVAFRGKVVIAQSKIKCSASQPIYIAILEWTGTLDSVTSDIVLDWTSGTYTANNFFLAADLGIVAIATVTPSAATWTALSVSGTVGASCNNLIVFIWTGGTAAQNVTLDITEAGLYTGAQVRNWSPRLSAQELALCQRYFEKTYARDTPPGTVVDANAVNSSMFTSMNPGLRVITYRVPKRYATTPAVFSTSNGAINTVYDATILANKGATYNFYGSESAVFNLAGDPATAGDTIRFHWASNAEM
jgi:hypothetical protein